MLKKAMRYVMVPLKKVFGPLASSNPDNLLMHVVGNVCLVCLGTLAVTYVLFQKKLLPLKVSMFVSKILFLPTFPLTVLNRLGNYYTAIDDTVFLGEIYTWIDIVFVFNINVHFNIRLCPTRYIEYSNYGS